MEKKDFSSLFNKGLAEFGKKREGEKRPVVVVGTARGGTSMIAGALSKLGVYMGDSATPPVYEDLRLSGAFENGDKKKFEHIAEEYTRKNERWGWKRPSTIDKLSEVDNLLNGPIYIFVFKDILSISLRNNISMEAHILPGLENALKEYGKVVNFLKKSQPQSLLVSYEKAIDDPQGFVETLDSFLKLNAGNEKITEAVNFIDPKSHQYLDRSRITKSEGRLEKVENGEVHGWARLINGGVGAHVDVYVNENYIGSAKAEVFREDLDKKFRQNCAFVYKLPQSIRIKSGDTVSARVRGDIQDLKNSPLIIKRSLRRPFFSLR